jgi:phosphoesterase RecJ-like protein
MTTPFKNDLDLVAAALRQMRRPLVMAHVRPDADALGSMVAIARAWREESRQPAVVIPTGSISQRLEFLADWCDVPVAGDAHFAAADGFVVLDTAKKQRCNVGAEREETDWLAGRPLLNIDHHGTNTRFGSANWVVPEAGSTCELVYDFLRHAGRPIDALTASYLFAGIHSDTLGFTLATTSAAALRATAELVEAGARVSEIGGRLYRSQTKGEFDLLRAVYANTRVVADGKIAYSTASHDEITRSGCQAADIDDQVAVPRSIRGIVISMLFTEGVPGRTRINFRSEGDLSIVELALALGGGGHRQAAGAIVEGTVADAVALVLPRALEYLEQCGSGR